MSSQTLRVVVSDQNRLLGEELSRRLEKSTGVKVPILNDRLADEAARRDLDLILVGNLNDNAVTAQLYSRSQAFLDAAFPGRAGFMVKTLKDPFDAGRNVILVGGSSPPETRLALEKFLELAGGKGGVLPPLHAFQSALVPSRAPSDEQAAQILEANRRQYQNGLGSGSISNAVSYGLNLHFSGDPVWGHLFRRSLLDYADMARSEGNWDFDPNLASYFRLAALINIWSLIEDEFSEQEQGPLREVLRDLSRSLAVQPYSRPDINPPGEIRQNHSTYFGLSLEAAARYFSAGAEASLWRKTADRIFSGQLQSYRPDDDAAGYLWYAPMHTFEFFQRQGGREARRPGFADTLADLALIVTDNLRNEVTFGDVKTHRNWGQVAWPPTATVLSRAAWAHQKPEHFWAYRWLTEGKTIPLGLMCALADPSSTITREGSEHAPFFLGQLYATDGVEGREPERLKGVAAIELDEVGLRWVAARASKPEWVPRAGVRYLDKLSLRASFEARDEYMLLDGVAAFTHGHKDANSILRLTWQDRIWLVDLDYVHMQPRYHNSIDVGREGRTDVLPPLAELALRADFGDRAYVRSDLKGYNGVDWRRNLIWRKGGWFVVVDELKAEQAGSYDLRAYWRTLGEARLEGRRLEVRQPGAWFRVDNGEGSRLRLSEVEEEAERSSQLGDWSRYAHADGVVRVLEQRQKRHLKRGESAWFINLLVARPQGVGSDLEVRRLSEGVSLLSGEGERSLVGAAAQGWSWGPLRVQAQVFEWGSAGLRAAGFRRIETGEVGLVAERPVEVSWEAGGRLQLRLREKTRVRLRVGERVQEREWEAGEQEWETGAALWSEELGDRLEGAVWAAGPAWTEAESQEWVEFGLEEAWSRELGSEVTELEREAGGWVMGTRSGGVVEVSEAGEVTRVGEVGTPVRALLRVGQGRLVVGDRAGVVRALEGSREVWRRELGEYWGYAERVTGMSRQRSGQGERVLVSTEGSRVHALDEGGRVVWSTPATAQGAGSTQGRAVEWWGALTGVRAADLDGDGREEIVAGTEYQTPVALLGPEGRLRWLSWGWVCCESRATRPYAGTNARVMEVAELEPGAGARIVYGTESDEVYVLDGEGHTQWSAHVGGRVNGLAVADLDGDGRQEVAVVTEAGGLEVLDSRGHRIWWRDHGAPLSALAAQRVEATGQVTLGAGGADGRIYVYDPQGNLLGTAQASGPVTHLSLGPQQWGTLLTASRSGRLEYRRLAPQRPFSRSSRHHY